MSTNIMSTSSFTAAARELRNKILDTQDALVEIYELGKIERSEEFDKTNYVSLKIDSNRLLETKGAYLLASSKLRGYLSDICIRLATKNSATYPQKDYLLKFCQELTNELEKATLNMLKQTIDKTPRENPILG